MNIGGVEIGAGNRCRFIAEVSNNHNGNRDLAFRLIDAARWAGADFVKFQCYTPDELVALRGDGPAPEPWGSQGWTMRTLYEKAQTPIEWFPMLFRHAQNAGIVPFASVFGPESLAMLESIDNPCYKIAALDFEKGGLRIAVERTGKPVVQSCAFASRPANWNREMMLYAPPGYPQARASLGNIRNGYDGYSYHGTDLSVPVYAVAAGAKIIEAHIQLDRHPSALEANVSLTASQFRQMIADVRRVEGLLA